MPNKNRKRRKKELQTVTPKIERRASDTRLMKMLDEHMMESLSDIGDLYQRIMSRMGAKAMQWKEYLKVSSSLNSNEQALEMMWAISQWRLKCAKYEVDTRGVMMLVADGMSISSISRKLSLSGETVTSHLRAALGIWSLQRHRVNQAVVNILVGQKCAMKAVPSRAA